MTLLAMLVFMNAAPDAELEKSWRTLLEARGEKLESGSATSVQQVVLAQKSLPKLQFIRVSGWGAGGHRRLEPLVFIREGTSLRVLRVMQQNLDEDGYERSVTGLWSCEVEFERALRATSASMDMKAMMALEQERKTRCTSLLPLVKSLPPTEELAFFLTALALEVERVSPTISPQLQKVFELKKPGPTMGEVSWVHAPLEHVKWKKSALGGTGMVGTSPSPSWLVHVDVVLGANFSLVTKQVAFVREFIE
ncbi:MAG: hypothetical protein QM817_29455 [Archangium sp.]